MQKQGCLHLRSGEFRLLFDPAPPGLLLHRFATHQLGGTLLGQRHIVWNFVSSRPERIEQAQADWQAQRFDPVPGETEFIPLPPALRSPAG